MDLIRGTTPTIDCTIPDTIPLTEVSEICMTFDQGGDIIANRLLSDGGITVDGQTITVKLTQEETLKLNVAIVGEVGIRIFTDTEQAYATCETEPIFVTDGGLSHGKLIQAPV